MSITKYQEAIPVSDSRIIERDGEYAITQNNYFGGAIANRKTVATSLAPSRGHINWLSLTAKIFGAYAAVAAILSLAWLGGRAANEWNAHRETSAQTELARIHNCID